MEKLRIDIVSDVMCPWCIIGYKQVEKALADLDDPLEAEIYWHPFELNPDCPPEGKSIAEHMAQRYGASAEQGKSARAKITQTGAELGFDFGYAEDSRMYNTFKAHKLLSVFAREKGSAAQTALKLALFKAYFQDQRDVSDDDVLVEIAAEHGMPEIDTRRWLADDALSMMVREEQASWRERNVSGVPAIIFDEKFMVPGAQSAETFGNVIAKVLAKREAA